MKESNSVQEYSPEVLMISKGIFVRQGDRIIRQANIVQKTESFYPFLFPSILHHDISETVIN